MAPTLLARGCRTGLDRPAGVAAEPVNWAAQPGRPEPFSTSWRSSHLANCEVSKVDPDLIAEFKELTELAAEYGRLPTGRVHIRSSSMTRGRRYFSLLSSHLFVDSPHGETSPGTGGSIPRVEAPESHFHMRLIDSSRLLITIQAVGDTPRRVFVQELVPA